MSKKLFSSDATAAALVERQMRNWELGRQQRHSRPEPERREVEDFICLSRMVGVEDGPVVEGLGARLGWATFGREILDSMAGDDELRKRIYESMDQRDLSWWEETLRPLVLGLSVRNDYFHTLCRTVLSLARQGSCVFLGRGIDLILPRERGFRVRLVAPLSARVRRLAEESGSSLGKARDELDRVERQRAEFIRNHFGVEPDDPVRYDVTINLERIAAARAVDLILEARRLASE